MEDGLLKHTGEWWYYHSYDVVIDVIVCIKLLQVY